MCSGTSPADAACVNMCEKLNGPLYGAELVSKFFFTLSFFFPSSFLMVFSHGLFSWSFLMVFSHGLFSWSFLMVFSHGLCCLFMAWSLATPIHQGKPRITFTVEVERQ